jgi:hypothetical protein
MGMVITVLQDDAISEFTTTFILDHDVQFSKNLIEKIRIDTVSLDASNTDSLMSL